MTRLVEVVGRNEFGLIEAVFEEGDELHARLCLDDPDHLYRQLIADWEADGNTIPPYEPPPLTPEELRKAAFPNLFPDQFWFGLRAAGYESDVRAWVANLHDPESPDYDPVAWAWASSKLEFSDFFERDHPLVESFRLAMGMPEAELDALWAFAATG